MGDAVSTADIASPDASGKAIASIIRHADSLFFGAKRDDGEHRTKDLFLSHTHVIFDMSEDGRLNEKAIRQFWLGRDLSAIDQLSALLLSDIDVALDLFLLALEGSRSHLGFHLQGIAQFDRACTLGQFSDNHIMNVCIDEEAGACNTGLSTGSEDTCNDAIDDPLVSIIKDHVGRLAAKFEAHRS